MNDANNLFETDDTYTTLLDIILEKGKKFRWSLSSHEESVPDNYLVENLKTLTLEDVERASVQEFSPLATIQITKIKKPNIFERIYNKLSGNK